jgi:hypothetical protein
MCSIAEDLNRRWCDDEKNRRSLKLRRSKNIRPVRTGRIFLDFCGLNHQSKPRLELFRILKIQSKPFRLISAVTQYHLDIYCHRYIEHSTRRGVNHHCGVHHHWFTFFVVDADFVTWGKWIVVFFCTKVYGKSYGAALSLLRAILQCIEGVLVSHWCF